MNEFVLKVKITIRKERPTDNILMGISILRGKKLIKGHCLKYKRRLMIQ